MLTYVYECENCGEFEQRQSISESALELCPQCGGKVRRIISPGTGFIVKRGRAAEEYCGRDTPCCGRETRCDAPPCRS
jgi:putative FmdB family regulatory protein